MTTGLQHEVREEMPGRLLRAARAAMHIWRQVAHSRPLAYLAFAAIYTIPTAILAHRKLLWDDEFFTLYLSTTKNWSELIRALSTGADQHPPSFYWLTHLIFGALGVSNLTVRLTAMIGFAVMCICLYEIAGRLLNRDWGFCAMILPLACEYYSYAIEGRGYGLVLGFASVALLAWMLASEGKARWLTLPLLAGAICGAVGSHYYAGLLVAGLAAGELTRTVMKRKVDWPVWLAFSAAILPVAAFWRVILGAQSYAAHFWAIPLWRVLAGWYQGAFGNALAVTIALGTLAALRLSLKRGRSVARFRPLEPWYTIALITLAILPFLAFLAAKLITHAYTGRYAIAAFPAVCLVLIIGFSRINRYSAPAAASLWLILLALFGGLVTRTVLDQRKDLADLREIAAFVRRPAGGAIAVSAVTPFHRLSFYARRELGGRLVYLADPDESLRYLRFDTIDRGMLDLNPWFPLNVRWFKQFVPEHPSFLVLANIDDWNWLPNSLAAMNTDVRLAGVLRRSALFSVNAAKVPPFIRQAGDPSGQPMLYSGLPVEGRPLCQMYMSAASCPAVD